MTLLQLATEANLQYRLFERGASIVVGVSGGADSVALLSVLHQLAAPLQLNLTVAHLNHGIRGAAADSDEAFVRALAAEMGLPFVAERADVPALARAGAGSIEEVARRERYAFLGRVAAGARAAAIAVGHTADDNTETVLLRILRGAGIRGLGGIPPKRPLSADSGIFIIRPLIHASRDAILAYLASIGRTYRTDATNFDTAYSRNRVRLALLPHLEAECGGDVKETLNRLAHAARKQYNVIEALARDLAARVRRPADGCLAALDAAALRAANPELQIEALRLTLHEAGVGQISFGHSRRLLNMAAAGTGREMSLPGGFLLRAEYGLLRLIDPCAAPASAISCAVPLPLPGRAECLGAQIAAELIDNQPGLLRRFVEAKTRRREMVDAARLRPPLSLRARRPGDRFQPLGAIGSRKLHDFFIDEKIPARRRDRIPIVCDGEGIVWVAGCRIDERVRVTDRTERIALLTLSEGGCASPAGGD